MWERNKKIPVMDVLWSLAILFKSLISFWREVRFLESICFWSSNNMKKKIKYGIELFRVYILPFIESESTTEMLYRSANAVLIVVVFSPSCV